MLILTLKVDFSLPRAQNNRFMKKTLLVSIALMMLLNLAQFMSSYDQQAQDAFAPAWVTTKPANVTGATSARPMAQSTTVATTLSDDKALPATPGATTTSPTSAGAPDPIALAQTRLSAAGLKPDYAALYLGVQAKTGTPWQLLAAVHQVETGQRGDTAVTSYAGAQGPMQFMPATFRAYGLDGDGDGAKTITDLEDAMYSAGHYLAANGASKGAYNNALYHYNHSNAYVQQVLTIARRAGLR